MSDVHDRERFRRDHRWARGRMSDHLDGDLAPTARERIERHLDECDACHRLLDDLRRTVAALQRLSTRTGEVEALTISASVRARLTEPG
jgi:anti-sigma factor RsiW